tara:strand:+ start:76 stop:486 length:411 start_codon:yes stop_codon:yes gene_type:complete
VNKVILFLLLYVASFTANAEDLILVSYPDQFFGESKLYIKNVGDKPNVVLTANLANASSDLDQNFLVPYTFVKIDGESVHLKQSLNRYQPVELKPGEMAFLFVSIKSGIQNVSYEISEKFGTSHGTWHGIINLNLQ